MDLGDPDDYLFETYHDLRLGGFQFCEKPTNIQCFNLNTNEVSSFFDVSKVN